MRESTVGEKLTQASDNLVDFTRIAERISSSSSWIPNYSSQEIMNRLFIVMSTVAAGCLGYQFSNQNSPSFYSSRAVKTGVAAFAGFFISHLLVILPLIKKRFEKKQECMDCVQLLREKIKNNAEILTSLELIVQKILALTSAENGRAQASLTCDRRARLMKVLYRQLHPVNLNNESQVALTKSYFNELLAADDFVRELTVRTILRADNHVVSMGRI